MVLLVKTDYLAYRGIIQLIDTIEEIKELINKKLKILGVIATMYEVRLKDDKEILEVLKEKYNVIGTVKKLAAAKKGIYDGKSVVEQYPTSEVSIEYNNIAELIEKGKV